MQKDGVTKSSTPGKAVSPISKASRDSTMEQLLSSSLKASQDSKMDDHFLRGRTTVDEDGRYSAVSHEPKFRPEPSFVSADKENSDLFKSSVGVRSEARSGSDGENDEEVEGEAKSNEKIQSLKELPDYLDHLRGRDWFDKRFPRSLLEVSPAPPSAADCVVQYLCSSYKEPLRSVKMLVKFIFVGFSTVCVVNCFCLFQLLIVSVCLHCNLYLFVCLHC